MATYQQQIIWHVKKADLQMLLDEAGGNYSALAFVFGINDDGGTEYWASLVSTSTLPATPPTTVRACPVPPDCK